MINRSAYAPTSLSAFFVLLFVIFSTDVAGAARSRDCATIAGANARIDCAAENMVAEFEALTVVVDELETATRTDFTVDGAALSDKVARMNRVRERSKEAGAFKNLARQQDLYKTSARKASATACFVLEEDWLAGGDDRDDNIICGDSPGEKCAEFCPTDCDDPDPSLDCPCDKKWDGVCQGKEVCEECCEGDAACQDAWVEYIADPESGTDPIDEAAADDIADSFQEAADAVALLNDSAVELSAAMSSYRAFESLAEPHDPRCDEATLLAASVVAKSTSYMRNCLAAYAATSYAHDACDSAANEDVLGFNGSAVCVVTASAKGIAYALWEKSEFVYDVVTSEQVENMAKCSAALSEGLAGISDGIAEIDRKLVELEALMNERFDVIEELLNTPQGQRPTFPEK
jgi:hypothetical protein